MVVSSGLGWVQARVGVAMSRVLVGVFFLFSVLGPCARAQDAVEPDAEREPYHVVRVHVEEKMPDALLAWQRWSIVGAEEKRTADLVERSRRADAKLAAAVSSQRALAVHSQDRLRR